jgi:CheY-like chemotaxis protein
MTQTLKNKTVLIVDDDERNVFALSNYLQILEMNVLTANNGKEGMDILAQEPGIEIILLDMMMPVMDGFDMLQVIKKSSKLTEIPVIAVTAKAMKGDMEKCIAAGATDYISKPVDLKIFVEKMKHWLLNTPK